MRASYITLGCKVNQYDTDAMRELMERAGYITVEPDEAADVCVINTCTVTNVADRKSRQMIRRATEANPDAIICVTGCLAQRASDELLAIDGVSAVLGINDRSDIVGVVERAMSEKGVSEVSAVGRGDEYERLFISSSSERTRAHIKISDGCDSFCSYCIIPYTRGRVRSREPEDILTEARALAAGGIKEVVLTGIHISSYGKDLDGTGLADILERTARIDGIERIRLGSLEPTLLTAEFCKRAAAVEKLCPHFHVSLQSGSREVLKRMNRKYTPDMYAGYIENTREAFDTPAITTDVIAGFVGETDGEHAETMEFLRRIGFAKVHVFPYSERKGTAASRMSGKVAPAVKKARAHELLALSDELRDAYISRFVGSTVKVLFEEEINGAFEGYTERYVRVRGAGERNGIKEVAVKRAENGVLIS